MKKKGIVPDHMRLWLWLLIVHRGDDTDEARRLEGGKVSATHGYSSVATPTTSSLPYRDDTIPDPWRNQ